MRLWDRIVMALEGIGIALEAIRANKVRATLTIAGVAIGVFVVVAMGATVHGMRASFQSDLDELGATTFTVRRRGISLGGCDGTDETCPERRNPRITVAEWESIKRLPEVSTATAMFSGQATFNYRGREIKDVGYDAQSTEWIQTDMADISPGRSFSGAEHDAGSYVVVVNDSLVMVDYANRRRAEGADAATAILNAGVRRFRPIALTTLTTFGGLAPMIFESSRQARFMIPMAISLGYGILFATVITLVLVPCLYLILDDAERGLQRLWAAAPAVAEPATNEA